MTQQPIPESLVAEHLALCLSAMQDCLAQSRQVRNDDPYGHQRRNDLAYVAKLMKASARLTSALAKLKGETHQNIRVTRREDKEEG